MRAISCRFNERKRDFSVFIRRTEVILRYDFKIVVFIGFERDEVLRYTLSAVVKQFFFAENLFSDVSAVSDVERNFDRL